MNKNITTNTLVLLLGVTSATDVTPFQMITGPSTKELSADGKGMMLYSSATTCQNN